MAIITIHHLCGKQRHCVVDGGEKLLLGSTSERVHFLFCYFLFFSFLLLLRHINRLPPSSFIKTLCGVAPAHRWNYLSAVESKVSAGIIFNKSLKNEQGFFPFFFLHSLWWHSDETWQPTRKWAHRGYLKWCLAADALKLLQFVGERRDTRSVNIMWEVVESMYVTRVNHNIESYAAFVTTSLHLVVGFRWLMFLVCLWPRE